MTRLLIVESPTKAKKIAGFLGSGWTVKASMGHIADLPTRELAVDPHSFKLKYEATDRGRDVVRALRPIAASADEIYLATDPDREGEAISWHLARALKVERYSRVTFNEITETAVRAALKAGRQIDTQLVRAQEARRALDRLVGYRVSSALSDMTGERLSAGRCQTPAVRLVVERQRAIDAFKVTDHFGAKILFDGGAWSAEWLTKPFLAQDEDYILDRRLAERAAALRDFTVRAASAKPARRAPPAPFTTSTLLQLAASALKFPPSLTQQLAQKLFEGGHITYHRTDNPNLSDDGIAAAHALARQNGWPIADKPRRWPLPEGAQEAHEAIRPTHFEAADAGDDDKQRALYRLIWKRAAACQLADAEYRVITLDLTAEDQGDRFTFRASSSLLTSKGWRVVIPVDDEEDSDQETERAESGEVPVLEAGDRRRATSGEVVKKATKPPRRYTEATLIGKLEQLGIGRPSTFAAILKNILDRGYVAVEKRFLAPTPSGGRIVDALVGRFAFVEFDFTRDVEGNLDAIASGKSDYFSLVSGVNGKLDDELSGLAANTPSYPCPTCGKPLRRRSYQDRTYWSCSAYKEGCETAVNDVAGEPGKEVRVGPAKPTDKQIEFARGVAERTAAEIPAEALQSAKALSAWIDQAREAEPPRPASEGQRQWIEKLVAGGAEAPAGWPGEVTAAAASAFLDAAFGKSKGKGKGTSKGTKPAQKGGQKRRAARW